MSSLSTPPSPSTTTSTITTQKGASQHHVSLLFMSNVIAPSFGKKYFVDVVSFPLSE